jgi:hypothetical protein
MEGTLIHVEHIVLVVVFHRKVIDIGAIVSEGRWKAD